VFVIAGLTRNLIVLNHDFSKIKKINRIKNKPRHSALDAESLCFQEIAGQARNDEKEKNLGNLTNLNKIVVQTIFLCVTLCNFFSFTEKHRGVFNPVNLFNLVKTWNVLYYKTPYNPQLAHIYDPIKVEAKINYHQREAERMQKLLN